MNLTFPFNGVSKSFIESAQPRGTVYAVKNMMPVDVLDGRVRGGQRPGLRNLFADSGLESVLGVKFARHVEKVETVETSLELADYLVNKPYSYLMLKNNIDISFSLSCSIADNFYGTLDGNGYKITGLTINSIPYSGEYDNIGLIGELGYTAVVKNLVIENCVVAGRSYVGALCGVNYGSIVNCSVSGDVDSSNIDCGGIAGRNCGRINLCTSSATVTGKNNVGGITGYNRGKNWDVARVTDCISSGSITGSGNNIGGMIGAQQYNARNLASQASGAVEGLGYVGGLCGHVYGGIILASSASGSVTGSSYYVGGLVGYQRYDENGFLSKCFALGNVESNTYVGGFIGASVGVMSKCYAGGNATGEHHVSAIAGGLGTTASMKLCRGSGVSDGNWSVGGICGASECDISDCYADGAVIGREIDGVMPYQISPMIGHVARNKLYRCHAVGAVSILDAAGDPVSIELVGGVTGKIEPDRGIEIYNCYWDKVSTGLTAGAGNVDDVGTGLTDTEMAQAASFEFDFYDRWYMDTAYPRLRYEQ